MAEHVSRCKKMTSPEDWSTIVAVRAFDETEI
jgi:hypothetical protein